MNVPKISVIVPVYNVSQYIGRAFDSLLKQSIGFENLEVILIDDASTDNCAEIIKGYSDKYPNVKSFFLDKNSGISVARNIGIRNSTADYLMFLDSDDYFFDDACECLYDEITCEGIDIVSGVHSIDEVSAYSLVWVVTLTDPHEDLQTRRKKVDELVVGDFSLKINSVDEYESVIANSGLSSKIFRKQFIIDNDIIFPEGIIAEDSFFIFNALLKAKGIKFINKLIFYYFNNRNDESNPSTCHIFSKENLLSRLDAYYKMYYLSRAENKTRIFKHYLLHNKLDYFTHNQLFRSDLPISELLDVLIYASPLFKIYMDYNPDFNGNSAQFYKYVANKDYENAIKFMLKDSVPMQSNVKVAAILDSFSYNSFKYEFDLIDISPDSWKNQFESEKPDLFLCESAYCGKSTEEFPMSIWVGKVYSKSGKCLSPILMGILKYCNEKCIPTIFWNKEDPIAQTDTEFNFVDIAMHFDYIFTSCVESVENYNIKGHDKVFPLMFAAQPKLFNPIEVADRLKNTVMFAGSWYSKFSDKCEVMSLIFDKILSSNFDLKIYDRFFGISSESMRFPKKYDAYINPGVDYLEMPKVYKESDFALNFGFVEILIFIEFELIDRCCRLYF